MKYSHKGTSSSAFVQLPFNRETQRKMYDDMLNRLLNYTSEEWEHLLENLDYVPTFRCYWLSYDGAWTTTYPHNYRELGPNNQKKDPKTESLINCMH